MIVTVERDQRWSMDFVSDQLSKGRRFRVLNLIDDYSREVIDQLVSFSISGQRVARFWVKLLSLEVSPQQLFVATVLSIRAKQCSSGSRLPR
jgi:putative transposase